MKKAKRSAAVKSRRVAKRPAALPWAPDLVAALKDQFGRDACCISAAHTYFLFHDRDCRVIVKSRGLK